MKSATFKWVLGILSGIIVSISVIYLTGPGGVIEPPKEPKLPDLSFANFEIVPSEILIGGKAKANIELYNQGEGIASNCYYVLSYFNNETTSIAFSLAPSKSKKMSIDLSELNTPGIGLVSLKLTCNEFQKNIETSKSLEIIDCSNRVLTLKETGNQKSFTINGENSVAIDFYLYTNCSLPLNNVAISLELKQFKHRSYGQSEIVGIQKVNLPSNKSLRVLIKSDKKLNAGKYQYEIKASHSNIKRDNTNSIRGDFLVKN